MSSYDVIIIGSGPGGYVCAIRCAQLGLKTAVVEGRDTLGGTCLNVGCIPSKALLHASHMLHEAEHNFAAMGLKGKSPSVDFPQMLAYKDDVISQNTKGIEFLFKKNKVDWLKGWGTIPEAGKVKVGDDVHDAKHIIIASGSEVSSLNGVEIDEKTVVSSTGALELNKVPGKMVVIGAGVIGLEMGSVWRRLGSEVTILEAMPEFLMAADQQIAKEAFKIFSKEPGLSIQTKIDIKKINTGKKSVIVEYIDASNNAQKLEIDKLIVAVGRVPNTTGLGIEKVDIKTDERGFVTVDEYCRTNQNNIYAVGDVVRGPMLAHKASEEGVAVAEMISAIEKGGEREYEQVNFNMVPWVIYTSPEIAWVGKTEQQLETEKVAYKVGQFPFMANGRARALGEAAGFVKVLADATNDRILGVHMMGPHVSELISEAVVAMAFSASSEDLARIIHAHPSLSETLHEAALAVDKRALHI